MAARMFEGCGNSRNLVSQLVDPDCAAGVVAKQAHTPTAISRPERRCIVSSCVRRFYSARLSGNAVPVRPGCLAQVAYQPVVKVWLHSTGDASPSHPNAAAALGAPALAALLLPQILPVTPGILGGRAIPPLRLARLGATPDFHHGLLVQSRWQMRVISSSSRSAASTADGR